MLPREVTKLLSPWKHNRRQLREVECSLGKSTFPQSAPPHALQEEEEEEDEDEDEAADKLNSPYLMGIECEQTS